MYDSNEVRVAVMRELALSPSGLPEEMMVALRPLLEWARAFAEKLGELARQLLEALGDSAREMLAELVEMAEQLGLANEENDPPAFAWQKRPRKPEVWPVYGVDAVAAGRYPARMMIRRGRR